MAAQLAGLKRFAFLDGEPRTLRYNLVGEKQTFYYTIQMTADGKVADLELEEE